MRHIAIKQFLEANTHQDLSSLYNRDMEVQVNVHAGDGQRVVGVKGRVYTDGVQQWASFRCPKGSMCEPVDNTLTGVDFDFKKYVDAIGMTGWDWKNRVSRWVAYDFDSITGHSARHKQVLTPEQLDVVRDAATSIPWVTVRKSTAGRGLHLYVFFETPIPTETHTQHAKLAKVVLSHMSALASHDFTVSVDTCGGNMWVWARKMVGTDGLTVVKQGVPLDTLPGNWRDIVYSEDDISIRHRPRHVGQQDEANFNDLAAKKQNIPLDEGHMQLIHWLERCGHNWWWDSERWMLVTHTFLLKRAHTENNFIGVYETASRGDDVEEQNCFCYPLRKGGWVVRRFSKGTGEHPSWGRDSKGWTRCFYNMIPDLATVARTRQAVENPRGGWELVRAEEVGALLQSLGTDLDVPRALWARAATVSRHKDGRILVSIDAERNDRQSDAPGWYNDKGKHWTKLVHVNAETSSSPDDFDDFDDTVRHIVTDKADAGWAIQSEGSWRDHPLVHVKAVLEAEGMKKGDLAAYVGSAVLRPWKLVVKPFQPEYTGDREWNRNSAKLRYTPADTDNPVHPTWDAVFNHCGAGLDRYVASNQWMRDNGFATGGDYLRLWAATMIRKPFSRLPYLFFYSLEQNTGKSTYHEALSLLFTKGTARADVALTTKFNGELEGAVLCLVEETNLQLDKAAYNKIKDWTTSLEIPIHAKNDTTYDLPNTTHWIQTANNHSYCPVMQGDTRITMITVGRVKEEVPKEVLLERLKKEASDFLRTVYDMELPPPLGRLTIPVIATDDKVASQSANMSAPESFVAACIRPCDGSKIAFKDVYEKFLLTIHSSEIDTWNANKFSRGLPAPMLRGKDGKTGETFVLNIKFTDDETPDPVGFRYALTPSKTITTEKT